MNLLEPFWWTFVVVGIITVLSAILTLVYAMGERTDYLWSPQLPEFETQEFLLAVAHTANAFMGESSEIKILNNGKEFMNELVRASEGAKQSINFTAYIWEPGSMSSELLKLFTKKAREGVKVRILLDSLGSLKLSQGLLEDLQRAGGQVDRFRGPTLGKLTRFHRRNHRRAIVVDGKVGFTGGMAVGDKWLGGDKGEPEWRDVMFEVRGEMAHALQGAFAELWAGTTGEILVGESAYPPPEQLAAKPRGKFVHVASSPAPDTQPLPKFYWLTIAAARKSLYIVSPYMVPDEHIRKAILGRARAGVDVRMLLPSEKTDAVPIRRATHFFYREYLEAGVRIYEYQPSMMHSKFLVADRKWSVIGSSNMDNRSKRYNEENVFGILDQEFAGRLEAVFTKDLEQAKEIILEEWKKRGLLERSLERAAIVFIEQF